MTDSWAAERPVKVATSMVGMAILRVKVLWWLESVGVPGGMGMYENIIKEAESAICIRTMGILNVDCW